MNTASTLMRVVENPEGGWDIREPGNLIAVDHFTDLNMAVLKAGTMLLRGGAVRVVNREGFVIETRAVPPPSGKPWWYLPPQPAFWVLGAVLTAQGVLAALSGDRVGFLHWSQLVMGLLGIGYLVLLVLSRRRDRRQTRREPNSEASLDDGKS